MNKYLHLHFAMLLFATVTNSFAQPGNQSFNPADAAFVNNPFSYQGITYSQIAPTATPGQLSMSINYPGFAFAIVNGDGSDAALVFNYQENGLSVAGAAEFRFRSTGDDFKLNSMQADAGIGLGTSASATLIGYLNNAPVSGASGTINFALSNASSGGITYTNNGLGGNGGTLSFNALWQNLDEIRIIGTNLAFAIDDLDFSPAVTGVMPVTFSSFTVLLQQNHVQLNWRTESELNNKHFVIERSIDGGRQYNVIGQINGAGNSTQTLNYSFLDEQPVPGMHLYRIVQVDHDGQKQYTQTIRIDIQNGSGIRLYPNPAGNWVELKLSTDKPTIVRIVNTAGQLVYQQKYTNSVIRLPLQNFVTGVYQVVVEQNGERITHQLYKN